MGVAHALDHGLEIIFFSLFPNAGPESTSLTPKILNLVRVVVLNLVVLSTYKFLYRLFLLAHAGRNPWSVVVPRGNRGMCVYIQRKDDTY